MNINSIGSSNITAFKGKTNKTEAQANKPKKSSVGINTGFWAPTIGVTLYDIFKVGGIKKFFETINTNPNSLKTTSFKFNIIVTTLGLGLGYLTDKIIDKKNESKITKNQL